jgi:Brp/Blh family beta-carotene 15,15'-monooxygenase
MSEWWVAGPFLLSLVLLGMPHGAIDHLLFFRARRQRMGLVALGIFVAAYLGLAVLMAGIWLLWPVFCCFALLGLTWFHWGEGDHFYEQMRGGGGGALFGGVRGAFPMLLPLIFHPEAYVLVMMGAVAMSGAVIPEGWLTMLVSRDFRLVLLLSFVLAVLGERWRSRGCPGWTRQSMEHILLGVLFLVLPPLLSIGIYFMFWHSLRHIRMMGNRLGSPLMEAGRLDWGVFYRWAAPFTVGGIAFVVAWWMGQGGGQGGIPALVGSYLVILWALTWPHALVTHAIFGREDLRGQKSGLSSSRN